MKTLAQRAADELNVEGRGWRADEPDHVQGRAHKTTMRLLARIDELEAQPTRRSEPMPEPVPEWLRAKAWGLAAQEGVPEKGLDRSVTAIARLIWERGDIEPVEEVDPVEALAAEVLRAWHTDVDDPADLDPPAFAKAVAVLKRGMELAKEIG